MSWKSLLPCAKNNTARKLWLLEKQFFLVRSEMDLECLAECSSQGQGWLYTVGSVFPLFLFVWTTETKVNSISQTTSALSCTIMYTYWKQFHDLYFMCDANMFLVCWFNHIKFLSPLHVLTENPCTAFLIYKAGRGKIKYHIEKIQGLIPGFLYQIWNKKEKIQMPQVPARCPLLSPAWWRASQLAET